MAVTSWDEKLAPALPANMESVVVRGDHAEQWPEKAIEAAQKARTEEEFLMTVETLSCDCLDYVTAEEKMALELVSKMPDGLQRD